MPPRTRKYSFTSSRASPSEAMDSPRWSKEAVIPFRFSARIAWVASARFSPATKRRVTLLNDLNLVRKFLRPSLVER